MADTKTTNLAENTTPVSTDIMYIVDDPGGSAAGEKITLANLAIGVGISALADWTPTVTQSGAVSNTVTYAKYATIGPLTYVCANISITGAGTGNNDILIGNLPANPAANGCYGTFWISDTGTAYYVGAVLYVQANYFQFRAHLETDDIGKDPNIALANGDAILFFAFYPTA